MAFSRTSNDSEEEKLNSTLSRQLNLANFAISSGVLDQLWDAIRKSKDHFTDLLSGSDLRIQFKQEVLRKFNIIVFIAAPITKSRLLEKGELVPPSTVSDFDLAPSSRRVPSFRINKAALSLFHSRKDELSALVARIAEAAESKPYIITGDGIGGSVASLFTLRLLCSLNTTKVKPPLCVTFGSPLLGDSGLQRAIADHITWNSCFLHVVSMDDCIPSLFVQPNHPAGGQMTDQTRTYHPFGRFMFSSNSGGTCFEDPDSALELLRKMSAESGGNEQSYDYGSIIASHRRGLICKDETNLSARGTNSHRGRASGAAQYLASLFQLQDFLRNSQLELLQKEKSVLDQKRQRLERTAKELNEIKIYAAYIGWYKKFSAEDKTPYYDRYKNQSFKADIKVNAFKKNLQNYWERQVKEATEMPQKAGAALRDRWLFGGTTYRRLVEPLAIADYYKSKDARNYFTQRSEERLKHYKLLEQWYDEDPTIRNMEKRNSSPPSLTEDSCFWAHVEEAIISCKNLNMGVSASSEIENLKKFEKRVLELIKKYKVSSDIFWEKGSFMKWWREYEKILDEKLMGTSYASPLGDLLHNRRYITMYESGSLVL